MTPAEVIWPAVAIDAEGEGDDGDDVKDLPSVDCVVIDAILARSDAAIERAKEPGRGRPIRWPVISTGTRMPDLTNGAKCCERPNIYRWCFGRSLPSMTGTSFPCCSMRPWLVRLVAASILREAGIPTDAHRAAINLGLKSIPVDRRRHRDREPRLLAIAHSILAAAEIDMKEHDRLVLARTLFERKLEGRRTSLKLPALVELVTAKPLVSAGIAAKTIEVTPQAARRIMAELGLREMTGMGRFWAWGVI